MKKIIALILALCCILPITVACNKDGEETVDTSSDTVAVEENDLLKTVTFSKNGKSVYNVIVPEEATSELRDAAQSLVSKIAKEMGVIVKMLDDATYDGGVTDGEYEILVGNVRRTDSQKALEGMPYKDYKIIVTEKNVVIASRDPDTTVAAIWRFMALFKEANIVRDEETKSVSLIWTGDIYQEGDSYSIDQLKIDGKDIQDYVIVYPKCAIDGETDTYKGYAEAFRDWIGSQTGYVLEVVSDEAEAKSLEILIGKTSRAESKAYYDNAKLSLLEYKIGVANGKAFIIGAMAFSTSKAIEAFQLLITQNNGLIDAFESAKMTLNTAFRGNTADYRIMQYNILVEFEGWGSGGAIVPEVEVRKELIASMILGYAPDVLVLCEFFDTWRAQLPPLLESEYTFVEIDRGGASNRTPIAYKTSRFNLVASAAESIETYQDLNKRVVTWAVLEDKLTKDYVIVFGTHFNSGAAVENPDGTMSENDRVVQAEKALEIVERVTALYPETDTREVSTILTGDFNTRAQKIGDKYKYSAYQVLRDSGMKNAFEGVAGNGVDHMFYNEDEIEIAQAVIETSHFAGYASDHKPIIADINIK